MDSNKEETSGDCIIEETSEIDSDASDVSDICRDREVLPRVGFQYQVQIPPLITECERFQLPKTPTDSVVKDNGFTMGLPIPIMWVSNEIDSSKHGTNGLSEYRHRKPSKKYSNKEASKPTTKPSDCENISGSSEDYKQTVEHIHKDNLYFPVPGCLGTSWSDFEKESFLLGIYIFGKNLVQVKRFIESKEMGDILSFYYGKFYRSTGHRKWLKCMKIRSRKHIHGQRIFTGCRQQEFLSRLLPRVPEKCHNTLQEVSKTFGEGKISLEEYVSTVKATVGLSNLIEVIGLGKGKQDLTGIVMDPARTNQVIRTRLEIPVGMAFSTLTFEDIVRYLKGDFRLSKARSNDLFWEAVWPRLLAKGWHSEQPKSRIGTRNKHSLVFIIPGVKKFSRRKLVKGDQYFDSVTDVMSKVASDPGLFELEDEPTKGGIDNQENGLGAKKTKLDKGGHFDNHSYLAPQSSKRSSDLMMFTVVDTSLGNAEDSSSVRQLRSLRIDTTNISTPTSLSSEKDEDGSEAPLHEPDVADMPSNSQGDSITSRSIQGTLGSMGRPEYSNCAVSGLKQEMVVNGPNDTNVTMDNHRDQNAGDPEKDSRKTIKCQFSRRKKPGQSNYLPPVTKRRRLTACCQDVTDMPSNSQGDSITSRSIQGTPGSVVLPEYSNCAVSGLKQEMVVSGPNDTNVTMVNHRDQNAGGPEKDSRKTIKCQFSRRKKPSQSNNLPPVAKRRRLTACCQADASCSKSSFSIDRELKEEELGSPSASITNVTMDNHKDQNAGGLEKDSRKTIKCQFSRRKKPGQSNNLPPVRKLTACCQAEARCSKSSSSIDRELKEEELGLPSASENMVSEVRQSQDKVPTSSSAEGSREENSDSKSVLHEKYPSRNLIDLNLPFVPSDVEMSEPFIREVENNQNDPSSKEAPLSSSDVASAEPQHAGIIQRQSTRNRPLTTRALEAFACGFLNTKRKPRLSTRARDGIATREKFDSVAAGGVEFKVEDGIDRIS